MNDEKCEHDGENPCGKCGMHWYIEDGTHLTREEFESWLAGFGQRCAARALTDDDREILKWARGQIGR